MCRLHREELHGGRIKVYLTFKDAEIDKKKVLEECSSIQKTYHARINTLGVAVKTDYTNHLAPQKTASNDMKATLAVKSKDDTPVLLNATETLIVTLWILR